MDFLSEVGAIFGFDQSTFDNIASKHVQCSVENPYAVIGIAELATDAEVKKAYRNLVKENHPDALTARGVPEEFIEIANKKLAKINKAYDSIQKQRGFK